MIAGIGTPRQAWAEVFEGTEGPDEIVGTPGDDHCRVCATINSF